MDLTGMRSKLHAWRLSALRRAARMEREARDTEHERWRRDCRDDALRIREAEALVAQAESKLRGVR